jgi:hypothetical protein
MGNLLNTLRQLIKEEISLHEDRLGKGLVIADPEKAAKLKRLYPKDYWIVKIITTIEDATDRDITRLGYKDPKTGQFIDGLKQILNIKPERINPELRELIKSGVLVDKTETAIPKKEKPESTGQRGRKSSDTSREGIVRILFKKWQEDPNFNPTDDEITYTLPKGLGTEKLSPEQVAKIKNKTLGLVKRGRPKMQKESLYETYKRLQKIK